MGGKDVVTIDTGESIFPGMSIKIPFELVNRSSDQGGEVKAISMLYYNVENLFPSGFPEEENE